ncbi:MAG: hypothetical protein IPK68_10200 [Bdellovibrionales bacterium]|nr:hypothetical protein [Bdellovibrionales bacterium]
MSTQPKWPKFKKGSNGVPINKYKGASFIVSSIGISLSLLLTIAYSNCGKMKSLDLNSLSQNGNLGAELFGTQNGTVNQDHIEGNISFVKAEIREDESTKLSWGFNWGSSGSSGSNSGYRLDSFTCNPKLFGSIVNANQFLNVKGGCDRVGACSYHADGEKTVWAYPLARSLILVKSSSSGLAMTRGIRSMT